MKIAICTVNFSAYSETFIKAQIDLLPASLVLHAGWLPTRYDNDLPIQNRFAFLIHTFFRIAFNLNVLTPQRAVGSILKKKGIAVVLAQYGPGGAAMLPVCKRLGLPLVVHFHGFDASENNTLDQYKLAYREMFDYAAHIIAVSKAMKQKLITLGCKEEKIVWIPCGPQDLFFEGNSNQQSNTFFAVGRFVDKKAPYLTILAFNELVRRYPEARLRMAGDGELLNTCRNIVKALNLNDKVTFLGVLTPEQIQKEMNSALAFVQHSVVADSGDSEGTPVAVLEAQASGLPVIATRHAGIPDVVIDGQTGLLVDEADVYGMGAAMQQIFSDRALAKTMGDAGRTRVKNHFSMEQYIKTLRKLLHGA